MDQLKVAEWTDNWIVSLKGCLSVHLKARIQEQLMAAQKGGLKEGWSESQLIGSKAGLLVRRIELRV